MNIIKTKIPDLLIIEPTVFADDRGYFFETYNENNYNKEGINNTFIQDNEALSSYGVIRGLHYQLAPYAQAKLVRVVKGSVFDVAVDLRKNSPTFLQWFGIELSSENKRQFLVPRGFAHGYSVLENNTIFAYKCDNLYNKEMERSIHPLDKTLNIDWKVPEKELIFSPKDLKNPVLKEAEYNF
jgi:dTDP-4-dehydrorhamnose 3,5-epimerase